MDEHTLKAGLEIHQQLDTGKLFCRCPSILKEGEADYEIKRKIRLTASELGEFDPAAVEMADKKYSFVYKGYNDVCCLVENDEEPPHECNNKALEASIEVSELIGAEIPDKLFVMRKTVIDGSNVSGFQRTMLVSTGGKITLKSGKEIGMSTLALEEDAARPLSKDEEKREIVYSLDRLGIPLIEIATDPDLTTPEEIKEAALVIGELLRITGKAKRGLGTIRQDVNISISGGTRVEIKGVQELNKIDEYARREVQRQRGLIEIKKMLDERETEKEDLDSEAIEVTKVFEETKCTFVKKGIEKGQKAFAKKLPKFKGILGKVIQPNRRFGTELASYVKAKTGLRGLLHSDELPAYGIEEKEVDSVYEELDCRERDGFVIVLGSEEKCLKALEAITERGKTAFDKIPEETRNALEDGNTEYSRPLPGAARMYPETDINPITINEKYLSEIKKNLPKNTEERLKLYTKKFGLSEKLADKMKLSNYARFFEKAVEKGYDATALSVLLLEGMTEIKREGIDVSAVDEEFIEGVMEAYKKGEVNRDVLLDFVKECLKSKEKPSEVIKKFKKEEVDIKEIEDRVDELIEKNKETIKSRGSFALGALMGDLMKEYKGKVSGKILGEVLKKKLSKVAN